MKVYVVTNPYDGSPFGVFATKELAFDSFDNYKKLPGAQYLMIAELETDVVYPNIIYSYDRYDGRKDKNGEWVYTYNTVLSNVLQ